MSQNYWSLLDPKSVNKETANISMISHENIKEEEIKRIKKCGLPTNGNGGEISI